MTLATIDTVVVNGLVRTLDANGSVASALAVSGGRVVAVGRDDEILELAGPGTERIDVGGRTVLPSFVDSHTHLRRASLVMAYNIDYQQLRPTTLEQVLDAVRQRVAKLPAGEWIQGDTLDPLRLDVGRYPNRCELDAVAPDHPVAIRGVGRHVLAANSLALKLAGIDRNTPDPSNGRLERDADGELIGILHEGAKMRLDTGNAQTVIPAPTEAQRLSALSDAMTVLHEHGIGSIHEMAREPYDLGDYLRLREQGGLGVRVRVYIRGLDAQTKMEWVTGLGLRSEFGDEWVRLGGLKFSIDGAETAHNAALYGEYPDEPGNSGIIRIPKDELTEAVRIAQRSGLQVAIHAIGPRAVDMALDVFETAQREHPNNLLRHRIEHAYAPAPEGQLERLAAAGVIWSPQPAFLYESGEEWQRIFGADECERAMPLRTATEMGIPIQLNSDFPCSPLNPFVHLQTAVSRTTERGTVIGAAEAISVDAALRYMTTAVSDERSSAGRQGALVPGAFADLMVLTSDPYDVPTDELSTVEVAMTMVDGSAVYRKF